MKNNCKRKQLLPIILTLILCVSIGYAFLSSASNLNGQASLKGNNFDVHFENIKVSTDSLEVGEENEAKITNPTEVTFKAVLNAPGDKYEFTVDVVNSGTVDAMIGDLDDIVLTPSQQKVLDYSITYSNGKEISPFDGIRTNETIPIKVVVNYRLDVSSEDMMNVEEAPIAVTQALNYVQADENVNYLAPAKGPTMLNIGYSNNDSKLSELKSYYPNLSTVTLNDSINVPVGAPNWDISNAGNGTVMAYVVPNTETSTADTTMYDLHIEGEGGISAPVYSNDLFRLTSSPTNISTYTNIEGLDLLNTSKVTDMSRMFRECSNLTSLDLSSFDTSKVTSMQDMFSKCSSLTSLDLSPLDTSNVIYMDNMFGWCSNLTNLNLSLLDTSKVTGMSSMFYGCSGLTNLDLHRLDTSRVTTMSNIFQGCSSLTSLDLRNFDTSQVIRMNSMFYSCSSLTNLDLSSFDTSKVTNMSSMFTSCTSLTTLDLSSFDTSQVTNMQFMFYLCSGLTNLDLRRATFNSNLTSSSMFTSVPSGINIIVKDETAKTWIEAKKSNANIVIA